MPALYHIYAKLPAFRAASPAPEPEPEPEPASLSGTPPCNGFDQAKENGCRDANPPLMAASRTSDRTSPPIDLRSVFALLVRVASSQLLVLFSPKLPRRYQR